MLTGIRVKITRHRLEVLRKGLLTEQATMKSLCFVFFTPHATYLEIAAVGTWRRASITVETSVRKKQYEAQRLYASLTVPAHDPQPRSRRTRP